MSSKYINNTYITSGYTFTGTTTSLTIGSNGTIGGSGIVIPATIGAATISNSGRIQGNSTAGIFDSSSSLGIISNIGTRSVIQGVTYGLKLISAATITNQGSIITTGTGGRAKAIAVSGGGSLNNSGTILGTVSFGSNGSITNTGLISETNGYGYIFVNGNGSLNNSGTTVGGAFFYGNGFITNTGLIEEFGGGLATQETGNGSLFNTGTIIGANYLNGASRVNNVGSTAIIKADDNTALFVGAGSTVTNSGVIESYGTGFGPHRTGYGIVSLNSTVYNTGTIIGVTAGVSLGGFLRNYGAISSSNSVSVYIRGGTLINEASGILSGAVKSADYVSAVVDNFGTIMGSCSLLASTLSQIYNDKRIAGSLVLNSTGTAAVSNLGTVTGFVTTNGTLSSAVYNNGIISAGVNIYGSTAASLINFSTIGGGVSLVGSGSSFQVSVYNSGSIAEYLNVSGDTAATIKNFGTVGGVVAQGLNFSLYNAGLIIGTIVTGGTTTATINNFGTIGGEINCTGGSNFSVYNAGLIIGNILTPGGLLPTIENVGTIQGAVGTYYAPFNLTVDEAGSQFYGNVYSSTLILAGSGGVFSGLGKQFGDITNVQVLAGGSWNFNGVNAVASGASLTSNAALTNAGVLLDNGLVTLAGNSTLFGSISGSGTLVLASGYSSIYAGVIGVSLLTITGGTVAIGDYTTVTGSFSQSGGTIALIYDALTLAGAASFTGGTVYGPSSLYTDGTVGLTHLLVDGGASWVDLGTISQTGTLTVGVGTGDTASLVIYSGGVLNIAGTVSGTGTLEIVGGYAAINSGAVLPIANLDISSGTLETAISVTTAATFAASGGTIALSGEVLTLSGAASFTGGTVAGTGYISTTNTADTLTSLTLNGGAIWQVYGTTTATGTLIEGDATGHNGRLSIWNTYVLSGSAGVTVASGGTGVVYVNVGGVLQKSGGTSTITATFTDAGTVLFTAGALDLNGSATFSSGTVTGGGIIVTNAAATLTGLVVAGGAIWQVYGAATASGTLTLGDASGGSGRLSINTIGTYAITGNVNVAVASGGSGSFLNYGIFEKTGGTGTSLVQTQIANTGTVLVTTGTLEIAGNLTGTGSATIGSSGTLKLDASGQSTQTVSFSATTGGELILNDPSGSGLSFSSLVSGFGTSNLIDLPTFAYSAGATVAWTQNGSQGTLTVTDGSSVASIALFGQYVTANFALSEDSSGGTLIKDPPVRHHLHNPFPTLAPAHH